MTPAAFFVRAFALLFFALARFRHRLVRVVARITDGPLRTCHLCRAEHRSRGPVYFCKVCLAGGLNGR